MSNPLLDTFDELYGVPKEETPEETNTESNDFVIPTAQVTPNGINLTGDYINASSVLNLNQAYVSNGITCNTINTLTYTKNYAIPHSTPVEQQFCKVMDNVAQGKATIASISADIDQTFTGFGGQIRYTVEIIGKYP